MQLHYMVDSLSVVAAVDILLSAGSLAVWNGFEGSHLAPIL
jgi:hypothetical protein